MDFEFFDPTGGQPTLALVQPAARFASLNGLVCSILDNGKQNSGALLSMIGAKMEQQFGVKVLKKVNKLIGSAPAKENELAEAVKDVDFVIVGTGD